DDAVTGFESAGCRHLERGSAHRHIVVGDPGACARYFRDPAFSGHFYKGTVHGSCRHQQSFFSGTPDHNSAGPDMDAVVDDITSFFEEEGAAESVAVGWLARQIINGFLDLLLRVG